MRARRRTILRPARRARSIRNPDDRIALEADIGASAERVFRLIAELRDDDRWLPKSSAFHGTNEISEGPIGVGTTYVEPGPLGTRHDKVTEFVPPTRIAFGSR